MEVGAQEVYKRLKAILKREWKIVVLSGFMGSIGGALLNIFVRGVPIFQATQLMVLKEQKSEINIMPNIQAQQPEKSLSEIDIILAKMRFSEFYTGLWDTSIAYEVKKGEIRGIKKFIPGEYDQNNYGDIVACPCSKRFKVVVYDSLSLWERLSNIITRVMEEERNPFFQGDVKFFTITYVSPDRRWTVMAARAVSDWIIKKHLENKRENLTRQRNAILKLLEFYKKEIDRFANDLKEIKKNLKYPQYNEETIYKTLVELSNQRSTVMNLKRKLMDGSIDTFLILTGDNTLDELQSQRIKGIVDYISLRVTLGDAHPEVKASLNRIKRIDKLILSSIKERVKYLDSQIGFFKSILPTVIEEQAQILATQRDLENAEDFYIVLGQNLNDVEVKLSSMVPDISIIGSPRISLYNKYTKTRNVLPMGFMAGIIIGILLAILRDLTTEYVLDETYLPFERNVILSLPTFSDDDVLPTVMVKEKFLDVNSPALNEFRKMAFKLEVFENLKEIIVITSTQSGEGKTFISANLASTLSISGVPTLLIDGDVRARSLSEYMGFAGIEGYSNGKYEPYKLNENFLFLPVGTAEVDTLAAFRKMIENLQKYIGKYVILMDMPPIGVSPEIKILEKFATKYILVTRYNYTLRDSLRNLEVEPSLVIFNFASEKIKYYSRYYKRKQRRGTKQVKGFL